ncbi:MAG: TRAP transporter small permease [Synergistaceae bacterium]|nr:TRAP transporter small permease [Synergistaceae bacterium]
MFRNTLDRFLEWMSSIFFAGLIAVVLLQVYARMFLPKSPHWTEEASRFLMLYMVAFAAGLAAKERAYVNVDVFINFTRGRLRTLIQLVIDLLTIALMVATVWYGWKNALVGRIQTSASLEIPMHWIFASMVLHSGSILLYTVMLVVEDLKSLAKGEVNHGNAAVS